MKKKFVKISTVVAMMCLLFFVGAVTANALVTTGLDPESGAYNHPPGHGLEDFESGIDGMYWGGPPIASTIPGVKFVTTNGQDWWTGDWTTGNYNGKYPSGGYTSGGQKWAWLGTSQGSGIIDFTEGMASYVSVYTSTASGLVLDAYADDGTFLESSGWATGNTGTGKMTMLSISRPTADIGYVVVHDTGNYWLIDWLCTDAPGFGVVNTPGKIVGWGGYNNTSFFNFNILSNGKYPVGTFYYSDRAANLNIWSNQITNLMVSPDKKKAVLKGKVKIGGVAGYRFEVYVDDSGNPGTNDKFKINIYNPANALFYTSDGTLFTGNIQIYP